MADTIFALSSGAPPAAIAVVRVSGPDAGEALRALAGSVPEPRRATLRPLRVSRETLDRALVLWFPGPSTATGEDLAELHLHGGRAVVAAVEGALAAIPNLRQAQPGEFTRRAFANGRIDLAEAEGLADLLSAETDLQRRAALAMAGGAFSQTVEEWRTRVLQAAAAVEAVLDFGDEDDVSDVPPTFRQNLAGLRSDLATWFARPSAESLKDGIRVVLAGPPNSGKSTLFNALVQDEAAITASSPGTTRDVLSRAVAIAGVPFLLVDTAGLREETPDAVEAIGIDRARAELDRADLVLWLGPEGAGPVGAWEIRSQADRPDMPDKAAPRHRVSARTGQGLDELRTDLVTASRTLLPQPGEAALNRRQRDLVASAVSALEGAVSAHDLLLVAEGLREARLAFDALIGRATTEDMLDALFGRFCIGK